MLNTTQTRSSLNPHSPLNNGHTSTAITIIKPVSFWNHLRHHKLWLFLSTTVCVAFMAGYVMFGYTPKYSAKATVLIKDSAVKTNYTGSEDTTTTSALASSSVINTMSMLNTQPVSDAVYAFFKEKHPSELRRMHIKNAADWEEFFQDGSGFISPRNKPGTDIIFIKFSWPRHALISQEALTVVLHAFQTASQEVNRSEQKQRFDYLTQQYNMLNRDLETTRGEMSQYKNQTLTANIGQETIELENARMDLQKSYSQTQAAAAGKSSQLSRLRSSVGLSPENALAAASVGTNETLGLLYQKRYSLAQDYSKISTQYTDESPKAAELLTAIKQTDADIASELKRAHGGSGVAKLNQAFSDSAHMQTISQMIAADSEAKQLNSTASELKRQLSMLNGRLSKVPLIEARLANLKQKEDSLSDSVKTLQEKLLNARIKEAQTLSNVFIVDPPHFPYNPDAPNEKHLLALSLLVGLGLGVGITYLQWRFNSSRTSVPVKPYTDIPDENFTVEKMLTLDANQ